MKQATRTITKGILLTLSLLPVTSCDKKSSSSHSRQDPQNIAQVEIQPSPSPGIITSGELPNTTSANGTLSYLGGIVSTQIINGQLFIPVEAALSDGDFKQLTQSAASEGLSPSERTSLINRTLSENITKISKKVSLLAVKVRPEVGFFTALLPLDSFQEIQKVDGLTRQIVMNPIVSVVSPRSTLELAHPTSQVTLGLLADRSADPRLNSVGFSGLERIGLEEFERKVKKDLGEFVDGSSVRVGVTDTGITFNHPSFFDAAGQSRIDYMKEFTPEGTIYFGNGSTLQAREAIAAEIPAGADASEVLVLSGTYLATPVGREIPKSDAFSEIKDQVILVSSELRSALLDSASSARISALSEASFAELSGDKVDLNKNGKTEDSLWVILLPSKDKFEQSKLFLDVSGRGDFRKSIGVSDWNASKQSVKIFAEQIGFELKKVSLADAKGVMSEHLAASIVGFDPGNHGSHVAGIIGGRKTIANDSDNTKARGVAPNSRLMMNRVCANNGGCTATEAFIDLAQNGAELVNMSLGGLSPFNDGYGVQEIMVNRVSQLYNSLFMISAGNSGPGRQTVGSPSTADKALSIGATATRSMIERQYQWPGSGKAPNSNSKDSDFMLFFSSRGPSAAGGFKPNISAPGTQLSAIQLNAAHGTRAGLDVYWGTSMAAPTATGAVALLIDAAKKYNTKFPEAKLPVDPATLHRVLMNSAKGFDVKTLDPRSGKTTDGQYTWIDQGEGMIHLGRAWTELKKARDSAVQAAVYLENRDGSKTPVNLDYEVRVLRKFPNGNDYSGATPATTPEQAQIPRFGRGLYIDATSTDSLYSVQIARRLPYSLLQHESIGSLSRDLFTTADTFELETVVHGSHTNWIKAGTLNQLDCSSSPTSRLTIIGEGAVDNFSATPPTSVELRGSNLFVCIDRAAIDTLPAGDHGAIINAYRVVGTKRESTPAFKVPVYFTKSHSKMSGTAGYHVQGEVEGFGVVRNYIEIPAGVSIVKVSAEVPEAKVAGSQVSGCAGIELMILEGQNTLKPAELNPRAKARIQNCDPSGSRSDTRTVSYTRFSPKPGIWDIHVFGMYHFAKSGYKLNVEFANLDASKTEIVGTSVDLNSSFDVTIKESSLDATPDAAKSSFKLTGMSQSSTPGISQGETLRVANREGSVIRSYDATVKSVSVATGGLAGSDLDLEVKVCEDAAGATCKVLAASGGATDVESATFTPESGKFYVFEVIGYEVASSAGPLSFKFDETLGLAENDLGSLEFTNLSSGSFTVNHMIDLATSKILGSQAVQSGLWNAVGQINIKSTDGGGLLRLNVNVSK